MLWTKSQICMLPVSAKIPKTEAGESNQNSVHAEPSEFSMYGFKADVCLFIISFKIMSVLLPF